MSPDAPERLIGVGNARHRAVPRTRRSTVLAHRAMRARGGTRALRRSTELPLGVRRRSVLPAGRQVALAGGIMRSAMIQTGPNVWRSRLDSQCVRSAAVTILGAVALLLGCAGSNGSEEDASTPEALADAAGCANITELDPQIAPIRGRAATRGISCDLDGEVVHIFARAPIDDPPGVGSRQGGTLDNIRRLLGAGDASCSLALLVSDNLLIVASSDDVLSDLGVPGEPPIRVSPTVSYLDRCTLRPTNPVTVTEAKRP